MNFYSWLKPVVVVGVVFDLDVIQVAQLTVFKRKILLENRIHFPLFEGMDVEVLKKWVTQHGLQGASTHLALASSDVMSKRLVLPGFLNEEESEKEIAEQLNDYFPGSLETVYFDFVFQEKQQRDSQEVRVFAARQSRVETYLHCLEKAGLVVASADVDEFAFERGQKIVFENKIECNVSQATDLQENVLCIFWGLAQSRF